MTNIFDKKVQKAYKDEYMKYIVTVEQTEGMRKYYERNCLYVLPLDDRMFIIEKPSLHTSLCFAYDGFTENSYSEAWEQTKGDALIRNFMSENLREVERSLKCINEEHRDAYLRKTQYHPLAICHFIMLDGYEYKQERDIDRKLSNEEREMLRLGFEQLKVYQTKRIESYLKKYGTSKLRTWAFDAWN